MNNQPIAALLRGVAVVHLALFSGVVMFAIVAFVVGPLWQDMDEGTLQTANLLRIVAAGVAVMALGAATVVYKSMSGQIAAKGTPAERMVPYRNMAIFVAAIGEGAALFGTVVFLLTGDLTSLLPGLAVFLIALVLVAPFPSRVNTLIHAKDAYS